MLDPETAALLRDVLDELSERARRGAAAESVPARSEILEAAVKDASAPDRAKDPAQKPVQGAPTMWR